jgi:hypothetical protein
MNVDLDTYAHHLDPQDMRELFRHGHWIPVLRGITQAYLDRRYPGWSWNALTEALATIGAAHCIGRRNQHPHYVPDRLVESVHLNGPDDFCIVWVDGAVTVR